MQEPKTRTQCDYDLQSPSRGPMMRCSTCKNRFYCSAKCQRKDWKEHKWNCSVLPASENVSPATVLEVDDEFKREVQRIVAILKELADASKEQKNLTASMLAPLLPITAELPDRLRYTRAVEKSDEFKYRLPIVTACRLLLVDYIATLDEAGREKYSTFFGELQMPTSFCEMYGPKILGRPADLSPGEYAMIAQWMHAWAITGIQAPPGERKDQVGKEAAGENEAEEREAGEEKAGMQWLWLAVALSAYSE
ncbi:hypothetical protein DFH06DRAFT_1467864 [Mycena polygramma]|nr:hypothetical protein DFH06DRAFT_1467864 [Mycena polygramma]